MSRLALTSVIIGAAIIAARLPGILNPGRFRNWAVKFPRSVLWGRVLMGIAAPWAGLYMFQWARSEVPGLTPFIWPGVLVAYGLVVLFADQFLAVRGAAALGLLVAKVMVDAADTSELPARLVVTVLAYLWVLASIWMTIAPHQLRDAINFLMANDTRCRAICSFNAAVGAVLMALGLFVY